MNSLERTIAALLIGAKGINVTSDDVAVAIRGPLSDWSWRERLAFVQWLEDIARKVDLE